MHWLQEYTRGKAPARSNPLRVVLHPVSELIIHHCRLRRLKRPNSIREYHSGSAFRV